MSTELVWLDRSGRELGRLNPSERTIGFALSHDGRQIAFARVTQGSDVWRLDLETQQLSRVTFSEHAIFPIWSADGQSLVYTQNPEGLVRRAASGAGSDEVVTGTHLGETPEDWSRDGRWLLYTDTGPNGWGIHAIDLQSGERSELADTPSQEGSARLSPNGRWLAYTSNESGAFEVFVRLFPEGDGRWQVSSGGGTQPVWSNDGKELFYVDARGYLVTVPIEPSPSFAWGKATDLFFANLPPHSSPYRGTYAVASDGQRFLVERVLPNEEPSTIAVVLDWPAALKQVSPE